MDILIRTHGPGVHCYLPFRSYANRIVREVSKLQELCKNCILKHMTLRRLSYGAKGLHLPTYLRRYLTTFTTADFEEIECAPFMDAFSFNFFHRALTYRVFCYLDSQEYMVTHGYCSNEEKWLQSLHQNWVGVQHENIMCVCGVVQDLVTNNVFYLFDQPMISLLQLCTVLSERSQVLPEMLLWKVLSDLSSALDYIISKGLRYYIFGLDNVFVINDKVVLENGLTRKVWRSKTVSDSLGFTLLYEKDNPEDIAMVCLLNLTWNLVSENNLRYYSKPLFHFIMNRNSPKSLKDVHELACAQMKNSPHSLSFANLVEILQHSKTE